jgi:ribosomal protein S18 acetylase RimI-like enzyme
MEIKQVFYKDENWDKLIAFVKSSSWKESPIIANHWKKNNFLDWERIFVAVENYSIAGHCSLNEKDTIPNVKYIPYIQSIFVNEKFRGNRLSEKLILYAMSYAKTLGFEKVYIVSAHKNLYEKYGFIKIDEKNDYRGELQSIFYHKI